MAIRSLFLRRHFGRTRAALAASVLSTAAAVLVIVTCQAPSRCLASQDESSPREPVVAPRPIRQETPSEFRLAYKFHPDQDVRMLMVVGSQVRIQKGDTVTLNAIQSITERHFHVVSVDPDGSAVLDFVIDNVKLAYAINDDPPVAFDTRGNAAPPKGFENVMQCIGRRTRIRVNSRGMLLPLDASQPAPPNDPDFLVVLPEKPVRIGAEWFDDYQAKVQVTKQLAQKITLRRRYTLNGVNRDVAVIHMETAEVTPVNDPQVLAGMVLLTPKGTILLDIGQGTLTLRDLRCDRTEVGALGPGSSIAGVSNSRETLR
jgi:hypothetical protein